MAHTHAVVSSAVSDRQDVELAHRAAALLLRLKPSLDLEDVVHELLDRQRAERLAREARGLNHWEAHAPMLLAKLVRRERSRRLLRLHEAETFYRARHREAVRFALVILGDAAAAEAVVSDTYRELLDGRATIPGFFTALVCNARNYLEAEGYRRDRFVPQEEVFAPDLGAEKDAEGSDSFSFEPLSHRAEDQDPLDILIAREEQVAHQRQVSAARKDPRWRYIKRRDWAAPLLGPVRN
ncbi:MAG: hypothetical protein SF051_06060 [Elusimicrobiota bacterium]|nr:hypothetical protein [Elusimicrobiota bacterium]